MGPGERKWLAHGPTGDGRVWGGSGSVRANGFGPLRRKGFLILYIQFPANTKVERKLEKIFRGFRKIWEFFWRKIRTFGTILVIDTLTKGQLISNEIRIQI
jgi:hypothetical protein